MEVVNLVNIKDWAKNKGFNPNQIKYDNKTRRVTVDGVDYGKGTPTYSNQLKAVRPSDTTTYYQPTKVQTGAKFSEAVLDDTLLKSQSARADNAYSQSKQSLINTLNKGQGEFKYDPETDPAYKAAMANAERNIKTQQLRNLGDMQRRGILNSSITTDRAERISADEMNRISTEVVPLLQQQARDRFDKDYQNKIQALQTVYGINKDEATSLAQQIEKSQAERVRKAENLTTLYNKVVNPTIDPADMNKQVAGMQTWETVKANKVQSNFDKEYNFKVSDAERQQKNVDSEIAMKQEEAEQRKIESDRNYELQKKQLNSSGGSGGGSKGSGGSGGSSGSVKYDKPNTVSTAEARKLIDNSLKSNSGNSVIPKNGQGLNTQQKNIILSTVNSLTMTASDRQTVLNSYGMSNQAIVIQKDPLRKTAKTNPNGLIDRIRQQNLDSDEFIRKLVYFGLYDYYMTQYVPPNQRK